MNVLLIGSGGREHALAWKLKQSPSLERLYAAQADPQSANPGIGEEAEMVTLDVGDHEAVARFCKAEKIALVVIGPEAPLVAGLADDLRGEGIAVFGPSKAAARLEGSKGFTKDLCQRAGIPTAGYQRTRSLEEAEAALDQFDAPYVLKADGLAAGKGVVIAPTREAASEALGEMFSGQFGKAGEEVVIEEFLEGEEASYFALSDGESIVAFGTAQDHKRVGDGDTGPNTGGMGAYSPAPVLTEALQAEVMERIIEPTVATMAAEGAPYVGVLYAGLMLSESGPKLIEYNCRFGDPECQVLMMRFEDDLVRLMHLCATGKLDALGDKAPRFSADTALSVVVAARGYPGAPEKGGAIDLGDAEAHGAKIFHAGTAIKEGQLTASGGRVLNVTARGGNVTEAQKAAYAAVDAIDFASGFCRRDIGWREAEREAARAAELQS